MDHIAIWQFHEAPEEYRRLTNHGGDEEWLLYCPAKMCNVFLPYPLENVVSGDELSYLDNWGHINRVELPNGDVIVSFAHA